MDCKASRAQRSTQGPNLEPVHQRAACCCRTNVATSLEWRFLGPYLGPLNRRSDRSGRQNPTLRRTPCIPRALSWLFRRNGAYCGHHTWVVVKILGPRLGAPNTRCRIILRTQKGTDNNPHAELKLLGIQKRDGASYDQSRLQLLEKGLQMAAQA